MPYVKSNIPGEFYMETITHQIFTPEERSDILKRLIAEAKADDRIAGSMLLGSGAEGFLDRYSDIDFCAVVVNEDAIEAVYKDWGERLCTLFDIFKSDDNQHRFLWVLLLNNFLEVDFSVKGLSTLRATASRWKVLYDKTDRINETMCSTWETRNIPDKRDFYLSRLNSIWYFVIRTVIDIKRGRLWKAWHGIEEIRQKTCELRGLREGVAARRFLEVDQLSKNFLAGIEETLIVRLDPKELRRALTAASELFFREAQHFDAELGLHESKRMQEKVEQYQLLIDKQ